MDKMNSENESESNSLVTFKIPPLSLSLINNYETSHEKIKFPYKKYNYKSYLYTKRKKYGHLSKLGMVNDNLRFLPTLDVTGDCEDIKISDMVNVPNKFDEFNDRQNYNELENDFYIQKLFYNSDFNLHFRKSQREIKLRKMLNDKIRQLNEIMKK